MGPIYGLDKGLADELDFLVMNPMEHADLSKISLATGADYSWNIGGFEKNSSWTIHGIHQLMIIMNHLKIVL